MRRFTRGSLAQERAPPILSIRPREILCKFSCGGARPRFLRRCETASSRGRLTLPPARASSTESHTTDRVALRSFLMLFTTTTPGAHHRGVYENPVRQHTHLLWVCFSSVALILSSAFCFADTCPANVRQEGRQMAGARSLAVLWWLGMTDRMKLDARRNGCEATAGLSKRVPPEGNASACPRSKRKAVSELAVMSAETPGTGQRILTGQLGNAFRKARPYVLVTIRLSRMTTIP